MLHIYVRGAFAAMVVGCSSVDAPGAAPPPAPTVCETSMDCPAWLTGECRTVVCDPTGENTTPDAGLLGCYTLAHPTSTPCATGVCVAGVCS